MKITREILLSANAIEVNGQYELRLGATKMELRIYQGHCYCELPGLYVGEIKTVTQLDALHYGLTGKYLFTPQD